VTAASAALEDLVIELTTNSSGDCGNTCYAKDIWKQFIQIRKCNKTTTDNIVRIVHEFKEKIKSRIQYLQQNYLGMLYLRCFTTNAYNLGECVDILKY
jgi:hypothetical protein